jgi:exopolysaccharide production protein ExoZ
MLPKGRYHFLEAARGVASLWVLLFHSLGAFPQDGLPGILRLVRVASQWGWVGVNVFFAISGWCIAERFAKGRSRGESGFHFAIERLLRIYPTYWAALLLAIAIHVAALPFNAGLLAGAVPSGFSGWLGSFLILEPYFGRSSFLLVSWSLVYELGFYLCAAIALEATRRRMGSGPFLFLAGSLLCFAPWVAHGFPPPWRVLELWPDFFAGVAAWRAVRRGSPASGYGVLALMLAASVFWPGYGGIGRTSAVATALILALAWKQDERLSKTRLMRPLAWAGGVSYSLYLVHVPLVSSLENLLGRWVPSRSNWFIAVWVLGLAVAIAGAKLLNQYVELPFERWRRKAV